jgi:hypothetical protein
MSDCSSNQLFAFIRKKFARHLRISEHKIFHNSSFADLGVREDDRVTLGWIVEDKIGAELSIHPFNLTDSEFERIFITNENVTIGRIVEFMQDKIAEQCKIQYPTNEELFDFLAIKITIRNPRIPKNQISLHQPLREIGLDTLEMVGLGGEVKYEIARRWSRRGDFHFEESEYSRLFGKDSAQATVGDIINAMQQTIPFPPNEAGFGPYADGEYRKTLNYILKP